MLNKYFKISARHLWRQKLFTILNIFGLAISISACWIIFRIVKHEFSYENNLAKKENVFKAVTVFEKEGKEKMGGVAAPLYKGIRDEITGIENVVPVFGQWVNSVEIINNTKKTVKEDPENIIATDAAYFEMLPYKWLAGNKVTALSSPNAVVLTESRAKAYFPGLQPQDIINQTITYYASDTLQRTVTGVVADYYQPSEFKAKEFVSLKEVTYKTSAWTNTNGSDQLYLQFKDAANASLVLQQINKMSAAKWKDFEKERGEPFKMSKSYELVPIKDMHFATDISEYGISRTNKMIMYGLMGIGLFLLLLACINYINISVAQIPQRGKEIGVRKTLGSSRANLISQFLTETLVTTLLACLLACLFSQLGFGLLKEMMPQGVVLFDAVWEPILFAVSLMAIITLLAGIYPAWLITRVKTINAFKNFSLPQQRNQSFSLQKVLIVFQFVIALFFITITFVAGSQLRYTLQADMGFNKEAVLLVSVPWKYVNNPLYQDKQFTALNKLKVQNGVQDVAMGTAPLSSGYSSSPHEYAPDGKPITTIITYKKFIDTSYLKFYQMQLLAGRNINASDSVNEYVINETAAKAFGFASAEEAIGKTIGQLGNPRFPIVGVVKDFHTQNFYTKIEPVALMTNKDNMTSFNIKLSSQNTAQWQSTIAAIEKTWYQFYPAESFRYSFYDETIEALYTQERQLSKLINLATIITIFISCLGLFGLATLTAYQRTKEIGIRKVMGATVAGIVSMLSKEYVRLVMLAIIIAAPFAWWAMNFWLNDFQYRINMKWWMFAGAGFFAILIALLTVSYQAIKAAVANPVNSLRNE